MNEIKQAEIEDLWGYAKRLRFVREAISVSFPDRAPSSLRVLDVGCGNGSQLALRLALRDGFQITGIDPDSRSIEHARQLAGKSPNATFECGRVEDLSVGHKFDVVILSEVLEHLERPAEMLAAGADRMNEEGILIVTVPNGYGEFEIDSWIFRRLRLQKLVEALAAKREVVSATDNQESGHIQFFTRSRLVCLFDEAGLVAVIEAAGSLLAGPIVGHFLGRSARLINWNARVTDRLPLILASGWYFVLRRRSRARSETAGDLV